MSVSSCVRDISAVLLELYQEFAPMTKSQAAMFTFHITYKIYYSSPSGIFIVSHHIELQGDSVLG